MDIPSHLRCHPIYVAPYKVVISIEIFDGGRKRYSSDFTGFCRGLFVFVCFLLYQTQNIWQPSEKTGYSNNNNNLPPSPPRVLTSATSSFVASWCVIHTRLDSRWSPLLDDWECWHLLHSDWDERWKVWHEVISVCSEERESLQKRLQDISSWGAFRLV